MNNLSHISSAKQFAEMSEALAKESAAKKAMDDAIKTIAKFEMPKFVMPVHELPNMPTPEERNEYQSASVLMQALAEEALQWKNGLSEGYVPAILAVLYGGIQIHVQSLTQVSFHGIRIEGRLNGAPCSLLAHQSTVQILCYAEEIKPEEERRPIGFIWPNHNIEV